MDPCELLQPQPQPRVDADPAASRTAAAMTASAVVIKSGDVAKRNTDCCVDRGDGAAARATNDDDGDGAVGAGGDGDSGRDNQPGTSHSVSSLELLQTALERKRIKSAARILRMGELKIRVGLGKSTLYAAIKKGEFPSSIRLGPRAVGWLESDVDAWLASRVIASKSA